jgi:hypothetical protein
VTKNLDATRLGLILFAQLLGGKEMSLIRPAYFSMLSQDEIPINLFLISSARQPQIRASAAC